MCCPARPRSTMPRPSTPVAGWCCQGWSMPMCMSPPPRTTSPTWAFQPPSLLTAEASRGHARHAAARLHHRARCGRGGLRPAGGAGARPVRRAASVHRRLRRSARPAAMPTMRPKGVRKRDLVLQLRRPGPDRRHCRRRGRGAPRGARAGARLAPTRSRSWPAAASPARPIRWRARSSRWKSCAPRWRRPMPPTCTRWRMPIPPAR